MSKERRRLPHKTSTISGTGQGSNELSETDTARRGFLRRMGKWGVSVIALGAGLEFTMSGTLKRSVLLPASAEQGLSIDLPPLPADQHPPPPPVPPRNVFWVATDGSDSNNGAEASPFASLQKALYLCRAGDGIYIKPGTYNATNTQWKTGVILRGAPGNASRDEVVITASGGGWGGVINLSSSTTSVIENVEFYGLTFQGGPDIQGQDTADKRKNVWRDEVLRIFGNVRNIRITNCVIRHAVNRGVFHTVPQGWDINRFPDNIEISHCHIYKTGTNTAGAGVSLGRFVGRVHVHHCEIHSDVDGIVTQQNRIGSLFEFNHIGPGVPGPGIKGSEDAIDVKICNTLNPNLASGQRTIVRNNICHGQVLQTGITAQFGTEKMDILDNLVYGNRTGIWLRGDNGAHRYSAPIIDIKIRGNLIRDNRGGGIEMVQNGPDRAWVDNNLIYDNGTHDDGIQRAGLRIDGREIIITNNTISNSSQVLNGKPQMWFANSAAVDETTSDNNTFYLPDETFNVARVGSGRAMKLDAWQSLSKQETRSTQIFGRFGAASPPTSPGAVDVSNGSKVLGQGGGPVAS